MNKMENVSKIFHISDIHIKLYKGRRQYQKLLQELLKTINQLKDQNSIAVVTGDIFHSKTDMSPESTRMGGLYLSGLADLLPTIIIAGNHDANLANTHRLDSLSPIVDLVQSKHQLIYLKQTGWHQYKNINFWLASIYDQTLPVDPSQYPKEGINIALYHGIVGTIETNGIFLKPKFQIQQFKYFDYVLLGDIHRRQILSENPLIGYAGSLTQLNYGQQVQNHGILVWNLQNNSVQQIDIANDYAFHNILIQDGQIVKMPKITSRHPRIKLKYLNTTFNRLKQIQQQLKQQYQVQQIVLVRIPSRLQSQSATFQYNLNSINDVSYQKTIIKEYIQHAGLNFKDRQIQKIITLNQQVNHTLNKRRNDLQRQQNVWSIQKLQFDNFFSYGQNNVIDFTTKRGVVGILGQNRSGKSALIDIIMFMLYDRTSRTTRTISILNNTKDRLYGKLTLNINGVTYIIQKEGNLIVAKRQHHRDHLPIKSRFYMIDPQTSQIVDLTGTQRVDTNRIIQQYIGTIHDARATFISTQGDSNKFLQMSNTDRKTQLNSLLNLDIFDGCYHIANDSSKQFKIKLSQIDIVKLQNQLEYRNKVKKQIETRLKEIDVQVQQKQSNLKETDDELREALGSLSQEYQKTRSLKDIQTDIVITKGQLSFLDQITSQNESQESSIRQSIEELQNIARAFNIQELQKQYEDGLPIIQQFQDNLNKLNILQVKKKQLQQKHNLFKEVRYDQDCDFCMNNPLTKDAMLAEDSLRRVIRQVQEVTENTKIIQNKVQNLNQIKDKIDSYHKQVVPMLNQLQKKQSSIQVEILRTQKDLQKYKTRSDNLEIQEKQFLKNQKVIEQNIKHRKKIKELQRQKQQIQLTIRRLQKETLQSNITLSSSNQNIRMNKELRKKYYDFDSMLNIIQKYKMIMGRQGLQYYITSNIVQVLEKTMNQVLQMLTDFSIQFVLQGKTVDINIIYPEKFYPVQTCSGFQKFAISIALRNALSTITNKSKGRIFIIDQGFGVLDAQNVTAFNSIIEYISYKYQTLLIVSHLQAMKGMIEQQINIEYIDGVSHIRT